MGDVSSTVRVMKADPKFGLIFGYAVVCKTKGPDGKFADYFDDGSLSAPDVAEHISELEALKAFTRFLKGARLVEEEHAGEKGNGGHAIEGQVVYAFPAFEDIVKSLGWDVPMTGVVVGIEPGNAETMAKAMRGELRGFSIAGTCSSVPVEAAAA